MLVAALADTSRSENRLVNAHNDLNYFRGRFMKARDPDDENPDDSGLFEKAMRGVKRLVNKQAVSRPVQTIFVAAPPVSEEIASEFGEELRYLRPGIQASSLQKLRRGYFPIEAILDLHGLTSAEASNRLRQFLQDSQTAGRSAVRVVHGKGHGSIGRQPVLKSRVAQLLREITSVLAFCSARPQDGGTGAVDVLLKKTRIIRR
jgi:DNA-nicking Smr family endonuclease